MSFNPDKPWIVVTYNLSAGRVKDLDFFEEREGAEKWLKFLLTENGPYSLYSGVYTFEHEEETFTIEIKRR